MPEYNENIDNIIDAYNLFIKGIDKDARQEDEDKNRAYGGMIRAGKGKIVEYITHSLIMIAWKELSGNENQIDINSQKIAIPIKQGYLSRIGDKNIKKYIEANISRYSYGLSVDKQVFINKKFVMGIECKSYAENAMMKRILVDFDLLLTKHKISCYLLQLESHLGGDFSKLNNITYGSKSTHTLMSYFNCNLKIITLIKGERSIKNPIHQYFKPLEKYALENAKNLIKNDLSQYI